MGSCSPRMRESEKEGLAPFRTLEIRIVALHLLRSNSKITQSGRREAAGLSLRILSHTQLNKKSSIAIVLPGEEDAYLMAHYAATSTHSSSLDLT